MKHLSGKQVEAVNLQLPRHLDVLAATAVAVEKEADEMPRTR